MCFPRGLFAYITPLCIYMDGRSDEEKAASVMNSFA
jgi:hypothetical protein